MKHEILTRMFANETPQSIFEIGCGGTALLKDISDHYGGIRVGGIDISKVRMENAKNVFPGVEFLVHDLNDPWPIPDNSYDIVFSVGVLMYMFYPEAVIREMLRVAKDKIIIAEYHNKNTDEYGALLKVIMGEKTHTGICRNYEALFHKLGLPITMEITNDKTIIKCQK